MKANATAEEQAKAELREALGKIIAYMEAGTVLVIEKGHRAGYPRSTIPKLKRPKQTIKLTFRS